MPDSPLSRLDAMRAGRSAIKAVPFPGLPADQPPVLVGMRPLTATEIRDAGVRAAHKVKELPEHMGLVRVVKDAYDMELSLQLLHLALVDPETRQPFASSVDELRDKLSLAEVDFLAGEAVAWQEFSSPDLNNPDTGLRELVDDLGKAGPSATPSAGTPRGESRPAFSGGRQSSSPTASSSGSTSDGSPPTDSPDGPRGQ